MVGFAKPLPNGRKNKAMYKKFGCSENGIRDKPTDIKNKEIYKIVFSLNFFIRKGRTLSCTNTANIPIYANNHPFSAGP